MNIKMPQIRCRKKPIIVTAFQFNKKKAESMINDDFDSSSIWCIYINDVRFDISDTGSLNDVKHKFYVNTPQPCEVLDTDWILIDAYGKPYPCADDVFKKTYDIIGDDPK